MLEYVVVEGGGNVCLTLRQAFLTSLLKDCLDAKHGSILHSHTLNAVSAHHNVCFWQELKSVSKKLCLNRC